MAKRDCINYTARMMAYRDALVQAAGLATMLGLHDEAYALHKLSADTYCDAYRASTRAAMITNQRQLPTE